MDNFDFENEFTTDEDIERMLDSFIEVFGERIVEDEQATAMLNPVKLQQIQFAYLVMKRLTKDTGAKVTYELHQPFKSMGSVTVEGAQWAVSNSVWFSRAAKFASNLDIYPLVNGRFRLTLTFHGLLRKV